MRISYRQLFIVTALAAAAVVAGARLAGAQPAPAINPTAIEFGSADHSSVLTYKVCFYPTAIATNPLRCTDVPVSAAVNQGNGIYRIPRAAWDSNLSPRTDYYPKIAAVGGGGSSAEVAISVAPFFFRLDPAPRPVTNPILVP